MGLTGGGDAGVKGTATRGRDRVSQAPHHTAGAADQRKPSQQANFSACLPGGRSLRGWRRRSQAWGSCRPTPRRGAECWQSRCCSQGPCSHQGGKEIELDGFPLCGLDSPNAATLPFCLSIHHPCSFPSLHSLYHTPRPLRSLSEVGQLLAAGALHRLALLQHLVQQRRNALKVCCGRTAGQRETRMCAQGGGAPECTKGRGTGQGRGQSVRRGEREQQCAWTRMAGGWTSRGDRHIYAWQRLAGWLAGGPRGNPPCSSSPREVMAGAPMRTPPGVRALTSPTTAGSEAGRAGAVGGSRRGTSQVSEEGRHSGGRQAEPAGEVSGGPKR